MSKLKTFFVLFFYLFAFNSNVFSTPTSATHASPNSSTEQGSSFFESLSDLPDDIKLDILQHLDIREAFNVIDCCYRSLLQSFYIIIEKSNEEEKIEFTNLLNAFKIIDVFTTVKFWNEREVYHEEFHTYNKLEKSIKKNFAKFRSLLDKSKSNSNIIDKKTFSVIQSYLNKFINIKKTFPIQSLHLHHMNLSESEWLAIIHELPLNLKKLDLTNSNISIKGLLALSDLKDLEHLILKSVKLENPEEWISAIQAIPQTLKKIDLGSSNISANGLVSLEHFNTLQSLDLYMIKLRPDAWNKVMPSLPKTLRYLNLEYSNISEEYLLTLNHFHQLEYLILKSVKLNNPNQWEIIIKSLSQTLKKLNLGCSNVSEQGLQALKHLNQLESLDLFMIRLSSFGWVKIVADLPESLKEIHLGSTNISTEGLQAMSHLSQLESLKLTRITTSTLINWESVVHTLPQALKNLNLSGLNITVKGLNALAHLTQLKYLDLTMIKLNPDEWKEVVFPENLIQLRLGGTGINSKCLCKMNNLNHLECLYLNSVEIYSNEWEGVINALPSSLKKIDLASSNISLQGIYHLNHFKQLEYLNLYNVTIYSNEWEGVINTLPNRIKTLIIDCPIISIQALSFLTRLNTLENLKLYNIKNLGDPEEVQLMIANLLSTLKSIHLYSST